MTQTGLVNKDINYLFSDIPKPAHRILDVLASYSYQQEVPCSEHRTKNNANVSKPCRGTLAHLKYQRGE